MSKRRLNNDGSKGKSSKKAPKVDFLAWAIQHRAFDTFLKEHLSGVDIAMLRISCKTFCVLTGKEFKKKEKDDQAPPSSPPFDLNLARKVSTLNLAIDLQHFRLACWLKKKGFYFEYDSNTGKDASIFRAFGKEANEQKILLRKLVLDNKHCPKKYFAFIAYWGNQDLMGDMIAMSNGIEKEIVLFASLGGQISFLEQAKEKGWRLEEAWHSAFAHAHVHVLDWCVKNHVKFTGCGQTTYYFATSDSEDVPDRRAKLTKWLEEHKNLFYLSHRRQLLLYKASK